MKLFVKYFLIIFSTISSVLIIGLIAISTILSDDYLEERKETLLKYIDMINSMYKKDDLNYSNTQLKSIAENLGIRITAIAKDGKVFYDSTFLRFDDLKAVENHAGRKEVKEALNNNIGFDLRVSATVNVKHLYVAKLIDSSYVLRASFPYKGIDKYLSILKNHILIIFAFLVFTILAISYYFSRKLLIPLENLTDMLQKVEKNEKINIEDYKQADDTISRLFYSLYKHMISKQQILNDERNKMQLILSSLTDGVILFDQNWEIIYANDKVFDIIGVKFTNPFEDLRSYESIKIFNDIKLKNDGKHFTKYNGRFYEIIFRTFDRYKILVFHDSTDQMRYHAFKSEIVANISHELKTPVSIIMGYSETLNNDELDDETRKKFAKKLYDSSVRLDNLINDIIQLHSLESQDRNILVDKSTHTSEILQELQEIYKDCSKKLEFFIDDDYLKVYKEHLLSILKNLIDNAIVYSAGNTVTIGLKKIDKKIVISVDDEGPIIPDDEKNKIFERFYTSSKSRNKKSSGTGLGLSIVKHTAELYGGYVELLKNVKNGNCFKVVLIEK
ncbi:MAG: ATP-binding protein [Calditerrivibrio sp.]|uniref:sensor histidine kinase n=1 Tax=Calditerrivibrio sp. TaxID=2792612 RepID=UPI003D0A957B